MRILWLTWAIILVGRLYLIVRMRLIRKELKSKVFKGLFGKIISKTETSSFFCRVLGVSTQHSLSRFDHIHLKFDTNPSNFTSLLHCR
ncbi:hypothetical protein QVD17_39835 [Tagetes erecta]|uniref:Uncharacterized protein n=1 Tax=Tagetes erecta TaxID=13708 RepID=A0AAD8JPA1_TARER|nr:hypothetical protein QVD17_39835 [Tagetes erecta]